MHHRNLLSRGHTEISLFYSTIQMSILVWLFLRDIMTVSRVWIAIIAPVCFLLAIGIQYLVGYLMDRWKLIDALQEWDFKRNPVVMGLTGQPAVDKDDDMAFFRQVEKPLGRVCAACGSTDDPMDEDGYTDDWVNDRLCEQCKKEAEAVFRLKADR